MYSPEEKVKWFAISSRIAVFVVQFLANYLITDHDAGVFKKPRDVNIVGVDESMMQVLMSGLTRWDGQYFLHIAEYGYTYENTLAFFPLYPMLIRYLAYPFQTLANNIIQAAGAAAGVGSLSNFILTTHDGLVLTSILVNNFLFIHSAQLLYQLTLKVTSNEKLSYASALLFAVNPASIFFSATYSESLYCFLTLFGLLKLESGDIFTGSLLFGLSSVTRSNGLVNIGYIAYYQLTRRKQCNIFYALIIFIFCSFIASLPFILYQIFCYVQFCTVNFSLTTSELIENYARINGYIMPGNGSIWCNFKIPLAYSHVQDYYWNVGFLKYYKIKQLPNFALAFPVLALSGFNAFEFFRNHGKSLIRLGLMPSSNSQQQQQKKEILDSLEFPYRIFPYVLHTFAMALFATLFMHIQVSTRFIFSSCPSIYWFCGNIIVKGLCETRDSRIAAKMAKKSNMFYENLDNRKSKWKTLILTERFLGWALILRYYCFAYFLAGCAVFANHLPWT